jgi:mono/diheme cytochrome c family protein
MKKGILIISGPVLFLLFINSCNSGATSDNSGISADSTTIAKGETSFTQYCMSCHNFRQGGMGPQLGGLTAEVPADWIRHFIRNPKKIIESGDERARQLFKKYKTVMPSFAAFTDDELNGIIAFLNTHEKLDQTISESYGRALSNPIP